jgi:hypothetical protein
MTKSLHTGEYDEFPPFGLTWVFLPVSGRFPVEAISGPIFTYEAKDDDHGLSAKLPWMQGQVFPLRVRPHGTMCHMWSSAVLRQISFT